MKKYLVKGSRVISGSMRDGFRYRFETKIIEASSWSSAVNKGRKLGWGGKVDFDVSEIKPQKNKRRSTSAFGLPRI